MNAGVFGKTYFGNHKIPLAPSLRDGREKRKKMIKKILFLLLPCVCVGILLLLYTLIMKGA